MNSADIRSIVAARRPEGLHIEYKRDLPGLSDSAKSEFLADVCAFANTAGGSLLYGISDSDGCPDEVVGVQLDGLDALRLRLDDIIKSGIEPRLQRVSIDVIDVDGIAVVEVTVPQSLLRPHWVSARGEWRFYRRGNARKLPMSIDEVRSAFQHSGEALERAVDWRRNSIKRLDSEDGELAHVSTDNTNCRLHYDGLITEERGPHGGLRERLLIHRDFRVEAIWRAGAKHDSGKILYAGGNERRLNAWLAHFLIWAKESQYPFPALAFLSLLNAGESHIPTSFSRHVATAATLRLQPTFIEDSSADPNEILRPAYDHLWQSYGFRECVLYDENGTFDRQRFDPRSM